MYTLCHDYCRASYVLQQYTQCAMLAAIESFSHIQTNRTCRQIKSRLVNHLTFNSLLNSHQSAYCKYSTETALSYIHDHLVICYVGCRLVGH